MVAVQCGTCGWSGRRPESKALRRACPGCDGEVSIEKPVVAELMGLRRALERSIEDLEARALPEPPPRFKNGGKPDAGTADWPIPHELRILEVSTGKVHVHRIPKHCRKQPGKRRLIRRR